MSLHLNSFKNRCCIIKPQKACNASGLRHWSALSYTNWKEACVGPRLKHKWKIHCAFIIMLPPTNTLGYSSSIRTYAWATLVCMLTTCPFLCRLLHQPWWDCSDFSLLVCSETQTKISLSHPYHCMASFWRCFCHNFSISD